MTTYPISIILFFYKDKLWEEERDEENFPGEEEGRRIKEESPVLGKPDEYHCYD
ncbi:MAG: hypothetical protein J7K71_05410 [Candidatus Omnitrophica bacterium]|nr:hypothetical protein [Candidatus Omnitrophota bacterium]